MICSRCRRDVLGGDEHDCNEDEIGRASEYRRTLVSIASIEVDWRTGVVSAREALGVIAALFVMPDGAYAGLEGVEVWDEERDARTYAGPWPVVAHPPCERWGRYWNGGPSARVPRKLGDDDGCFAAALAAVRRWGGVLEHPEGSHAWRHFGLITPPRSGGWVYADWGGGWTCCIEQGAYGHRARKATWLYACGVDIPSLSWGRAPGDFVRLDQRFHSKKERARAIKTGACQRLSKRQRASTPEGFRDLLLSIARTARRQDLRNEAA